MDSADLIASDRHQSAWPMYRALVGIGLICALLIVAAYLVTGPRIAANRAALLQGAILRVLPGAVAYRQIEPGVYLGVDDAAAPVGFAVEAQGMGYQDTIRILYGYDPVTQAVVGLQVLASKETPGLGDRIEKDTAFLANFKALSVRVAADGLSLARPLVWVAPGQKTEPWQIDGIAGATISSKAVARMLADSTAGNIAALYRRRNAAVEPWGIDGT